jgi:hypothetical protein
VLQTLVHRTLVHVVNYWPVVFFGPESPLLTAGAGGREYWRMWAMDA